MQGLKPLEGWRPIQPCCSCAGSKSRSGRPACGWRSQRDRQQVPHWWRKPEANTCLAPAALPTRVTSQKDADDLREEALRSIAAQRVDEQPGPPQVCSPPPVGLILRRGGGRSAFPWLHTRHVCHMLAACKIAQEAQEGRLHPLPRNGCMSDKYACHGRGCAESCNRSPDAWPRKGMQAR